MKIAVVQINPVIGDYKGNCEKILSFSETARSRGCDLVVFPELAVTGYPPRDLLEREAFVDLNLEYLNRLISGIEGVGVICGYVDQNEASHGNTLYNAAVLFENGKVLQRAYKRLLPTYDVFDERRYFACGSSYDTFIYKGTVLGLTICEDVWNDKNIFVQGRYETDPVEELKRNGAELIVNISASPFHTGKTAFKKEMLSRVAARHGVPVIYSNQVGGNDSVLFDGGSMVFDETGTMRAEASDFEEDLVVYDTETREGEFHAVSENRNMAVQKALVMGTRDYVIKCGFKKAVIGLSGGIDSALTAAIAVEALGAENVLSVFMPSEYTSDDNFEDTRKLAENLGTELITIPIKNLFESFVEVSPEFDKEAYGVTEQNLQARIRGTILMAYSNKRGGIVLTTGNKSEIAVGYCTLYGDMNGGLAVISDLPKTMVYEISNHINREKEIIPVRIIEKAPSAELKPDQTDQDDLPSYGTLDGILKAYIEEFKGAEEIAGLGYDEATVRDIIQRVERNEYKRQQAAPGLRITSKAFGYGRRYPIAKK